MLTQTLINQDLEKIFEAQQANRLAVANTNYRQRLDKIRKLRDAVLRHRQDIRDALKADMNEPETEVDLVEVYRIISEVKHAEKHLSNLMRPRKVGTPMSLMGMSSYIQYEPKGVCLIISPWNFPFDLTINPLIAAVAAGNCVIVKPSEISANSAKVVRRIIEEVFDKNEVCVVEGDASVAGDLLKLPFNHIFFTGAPSIGKIVMRAAADHLASVTLELGGKSPVIVDETADIQKTARRLVGAKLVKCGQMCITPDYVLVHESKKNELIEALKNQFKIMAGDSDEARINGEYSRIVSDRHFKRVKNYLEDAVMKGANVAFGGTHREDLRYIAPTILTDVNEEMLVMQEEIFGPLLPILTYTNLKEAIKYINDHHKPLSLYIFSKKDETQKFILNHTSAGGVTINAASLHPLNNDLPFGGMNNSGIGKSHGEFGFKEFSHEKAVMKVAMPFVSSDMIYPPYTSKVKKIVEMTLKWF